MNLHILTLRLKPNSNQFSILKLLNPIIKLFGLYKPARTFRFGFANAPMQFNVSSRKPLPALLNNLLAARLDLVLYSQVLTSVSLPNTLHIASQFDRVLQLLLSKGIGSLNWSVNSCILTAILARNVRTKTLVHTMLRNKHN